MSEHQPIFDPAKRRLCPDGACIGLLGANGRCGVCGLVQGEGAPLDTSEPLPPAHEEAKIEAREAAWDSDREDDGGFDPKRRLCSDGACTGLVGANGRCKECGLSAEA